MNFPSFSFQYFQASIKSNEQNKSKSLSFNANAITKQMPKKSSDSRLTQIESAEYDIQKLLASHMIENEGFEPHKRIKLETVIECLNEMWEDNDLGMI
eukprot:gene3015-5025_t